LLQAAIDQFMSSPDAEELTAEQASADAPKVNVVRVLFHFSRSSSVRCCSVFDSRSSHYQSLTQVVVGRITARKAVASHTPPLHGP